jgi:hypothetical protein
MTMAQERTRLTVDVSQRFLQYIDDLTYRIGITRADAFRMGLDHLIAARNASKAGMTVGAWRDDEKRGIRIEREFRLKSVF